MPLVVGTSETCVGQVTVDDPLVGDPDGDIALDEDTEEQSKKRKEAEESFKVGALAHSLIGQRLWRDDLHGEIHSCIHAQN